MDVEVPGGQQGKLLILASRNPLVYFSTPRPPFLMPLSLSNLPPNVQSHSSHNPPQYTSTPSLPPSSSPRPTPLRPPTPSSAAGRIPTLPLKASASCPRPTASSPALLQDLETKALGLGRSLHRLAGSTTATAWDLICWRRIIRGLELQLGSMLRYG